MNPPPPKLSLIVPTMGKPGGVLRMLDSVIYHAPRSLLTTTELVVFLNADPEAQPDATEIEAYLQKHGALFHSTQFIKATKFHLTAEESALVAFPYATGDYVWLVGDKRIFLPEGLAQLAKYIESPATPCAYFNSVWQNSDGHTNAEVSTYFNKTITTIPYKNFVQRTGVNFMATNMGTWVYQRQFLDTAIWQHIVKNCGPHFSHVATLLATMGKVNITCYAVFLSILEAKAYHSGSGDEWDRYARLSGTYRYYAWTFGLVRQFQYLISQGHYSYADVRRSMCSEKNLLARQVDEIYGSFTSQIWRGWLDAKEQIKRDEFEEILGFLSLACPERAIIHGILQKLYEESYNKSAGRLVGRMRDACRAIHVDYPELKLLTLIVGQVGDQYIRLHPRGYILSKISDSSNFMLAYKLLDPPLKSRYWQIIGESELASVNYHSGIQFLNGLFPRHAKLREPVFANNRMRFRKLAKNMMSAFYAPALLDRVPKVFVVFLWNRFL